jgi:hypothetical protein
VLCLFGLLGLLLAGLIVLIIAPEYLTWALSRCPSSFDMTSPATRQVPRVGRPRGTCIPPGPGGLGAS